MTADTMNALAARLAAIEAKLDKLDASNHLATVAALSAEHGERAVAELRLELQGVRGTQAKAIEALQRAREELKDERKAHEETLAKLAAAKTLLGRAKTTIAELRSVAPGGLDVTIATAESIEADIRAFIAEPGETCGGSGGHLGHIGDAAPDCETCDGTGEEVKP